MIGALVTGIFITAALISLVLIGTVFLIEHTSENVWVSGLVCHVNVQCLVFKATAILILTKIIPRIHIIAFNCVTI